MGREVKGGLLRRGPVWYLRYFVNGREVRISTHERDERRAEEFRDRHMRDIRAMAMQRQALVSALGSLKEHRLSGAEVIALRLPLVYVWSRGTRVLYVGKGDQGLARPLHPDHHRLVGVEPTDELKLWWCTTAAEAVQIERMLITKLKPELNHGFAQGRPSRKRLSPKAPDHQTM